METRWQVMVHGDQTKNIGLFWKPLCLQFVSVFAYFMTMTGVQLSHIKTSHVSQARQYRIELTKANIFVIINVCLSHYAKQPTSLFSVGFKVFKVLTIFALLLELFEHAVKFLGLLTIALDICLWVFSLPLFPAQFCLFLGMKLFFQQLFV